MGDPIVKRCEVGDAFHMRCLVKKAAPLSSVKRIISTRKLGRWAARIAPGGMCPQKNIVFSGYQNSSLDILGHGDPRYVWRGFSCLNDTDRKSTPPEGKLVYSEGFEGTPVKGLMRNGRTRVAWIRCGLTNQEVRRAICWRRINRWHWKTCDASKVKLKFDYNHLGQCTYDWIYTGAIKVKSSAEISLDRAKRKVAIALARTKEYLAKIKIYFFDNSHVLGATSCRMLDGLARLLKANRGVRIEIGGHASKVGLEGANLLLSSKRAITVYKYLIGKGVKRDQLKVHGYGTSRDAGRGHAANRRVEFRVVK